MIRDKLVNHPVNDNQAASVEWMNTMREIESEPENKEEVDNDKNSVSARG